MIKYFVNQKFKLILRESNYPIKSYKSLTSILNIIFRLFYSGADKLIVQNNTIKNYLIKNFFVNKKKIQVVSNLIDIKYIRKKASEKLKVFNKKKNQKILINVASLNEQKNQIEILRAFKNLKNYKYDFKLLLIGDGKNKEKLKKYIKNHNLKNISFLGNLSNPYKYIKNSDLMILSSKWEGMPNVLLEAQCLDVKCISSDCYTGPRELKQKGFDISLYKSGNYNDLVKKIKKHFKFKRLNKSKIKILNKLNDQSKMSIKSILK